jgi:hypothetical protein
MLTAAFAQHVASCHQLAGSLQQIGLWSHITCLARANALSWIVLFVVPAVDENYFRRGDVIETVIGRTYG